MVREGVLNRSFMSLRQCKVEHSFRFVRVGGVLCLGKIKSECLM